jgi:hypothetical protein
LAENAKAVGEVAKTTSNAIDAVREAGGWLNRIFGSAIEDAVALHWSDRVRARRIEAAIFDWGRLAELVHKTATELKAKGIDTTRPVPPKIAIPLLENATMEDDDELHSKWAKLLANALNPSADDAQKKFVTTLAELTSRDVQVFEILCTEWKSVDKTKFTKDATLKYGPGVDAGKDHDEISVITLSRLGLIAPSFTESSAYSPPGHDDRFGDYGAGGDAVRAYGNLEIVTVTPFGEAFYRAVSFQLSSVCFCICSMMRSSNSKSAPATLSKSRCLKSGSLPTSM